MWFPGPVQKVEYKALASTCTEILWLRSLLVKLHILPSIILIIYNLLINFKFYKNYKLAILESVVGVETLAIWVY